MKYFLKENSQGDNIYILALTIYQLLYNVHSYDITCKLSQIYKQYPCSILCLIVILYETRPDIHNYFWYFQRFHNRNIYFKVALCTAEDKWYVKNLNSKLEMCPQDTDAPTYVIVDGWTEGLMNKGKSKCPPPLSGGIKTVYFVTSVQKMVLNTVSSKYK